jgi:hypothetical protein
MMDTTDFLRTMMVVWAMIGAIVTPIVYTQKGRSPWAGLFVGMALGALGGILLLAPLWIFIRPPGKKCPHCAETVLSEALVCKHCGYEFPAPSDARVSSNAV